ncbi:MAG TPA: hypothetical protein VGB85_01760 [Nannocystis sp.]|jgi:hypothetical protein
MLARWLCVALVGSACTRNEPEVVAVAPVAEAPAPAREPPPRAASGVELAALDALLRPCQGEEEGHPLGTLVSVERLGAWKDRPVYLARTTGGGDVRMLLFADTTGSCPAFVLGPEAAQVRGDFFGEGTQRTAGLLSQASDGVRCDNDACPVAVLLRDEDGVVLAAANPGLECETYTLASVRLFADRDSIELRCSGGTVDTAREIQLLHAFGRELRPLLAFDAGITTVTLSEDETRECTSRSRDGSYEIKATGAAPVVEVFAVSDLQAATRATWTFDAAQQRMVQGTPVPVKLPAPRATCRAAG